MQTGADDKRRRLTEAAGRLALRQTFGGTTIAQIAAEAQVPAGNVYYYFRTREAIGEALIDRQLEVHRTQRRQWQGMGPRERLVAFVGMTLEQRDELARYGCPTGSLCTELGKVDPVLAARARPLLEEWRAWLEDQFRALGQAGESAALAVHVLAVLQGAAVLAHGLGTPDCLVQEGERLIRWIGGLAATAAGAAEGEATT